MSKRKAAADEQSNLAKSGKRNKSDELGNDETLVGQLTALLDAHADASNSEAAAVANQPPPTPTPTLVTQVQALAVKYNQKQVALIFKTVFDRLIQTATVATTATPAVEADLGRRLSAVLVQLSADAIPFVACSRHLCALLDTAAAVAADGHRVLLLRQQWFVDTFDTLATRLAKSKSQRTIFNSVHVSLDRLLDALCRVEDNNNNENTIDDERLEALESAMRMSARLSFARQFNARVHVFIAALLRRAALLLTTGDSVHRASLKRAALALVRLVSIVSSSQSESDDTASSCLSSVYTFVLDAAAHLELDTTAAESAHAHQLVQALLEHLHNADTANCVQHMCGVMERRLSTGCFRSLIAKSSFLVVYMYSQLVALRTATSNDEWWLETRKASKAEASFVTQMTSCASLARLRRDHGWIRAASRLPASSPSSSASETDDDLVHVFACLTSARVRHLLANTRCHQIAAPYERSLQRIAFLLVETRHPELRLLASQLVDYLLANDSCIVGSDQQQQQRLTLTSSSIALLRALVVKCLPAVAAAAKGHNDSEEMCNIAWYVNELTRLLSSGSRQRNNLASAHQACIVRTLYGQAVGNEMQPECYAKRVALVGQVFDRVLLAVDILVKSEQATLDTSLNQLK